MALKFGTKLGPYQITDPAGAGGMGEVYRARDLRLERDVAIKVLPAHLSQSSSLRQRFEREARAASSLNHPNICAVYDIGHQEGIDFLVMEFLDGETLSARLEKGPLPVDELLRHAVDLADARSDIFAFGILLYEMVTGVSTLVWYDREGKRGEEISEPGIVFAPRLSQDERFLAYELQGDIWVHDLIRGTDSRLSFGTNYESTPVWSPDGSSILFSSQEGRGGALYRKLTSGLGDAEKLFENLDLPIFATDWSPNGSSLLLSILDKESGWDLSSYTLENGTITPLLTSPFMELDGRYSPDGEWFAYSSNESGALQIYVVRISGPGGRWQISTNGGWAPAWKQDGTEIYFIAPGGNLMAVQVELGDRFKAGIPAALFQAPLRSGTAWPFEPTADGQRFVVNILPQSSISVPPILVQNWTASADQ